ncbi:MAG: M14 family metallopeptidase, partial [Bacteroidetes bacterium]|nr:M14 family metallopeptidase [Bacteroidota bacterium]
LAEHSPYAKLVTFGKSPQGRNLYCLIVSKDKVFTPAFAKKTGKPILMIQNGIHAGEIEGKDACMLLLREILVTKEKQNLLDKMILLVIPVFNVDGHERISQYNRINQNGPTKMGWRTTAQNLNLNRDYTKADAPEMKSFLKLFNSWLPDFSIDTHTTDGQDFQYSVTYGIEKNGNVPPMTRQWIRNDYIPKMEKGTEESGFKILPYADFKDGDFHKGLVDWVSGPRFSHGYAAIQNRPGLLIETHMLKPYKERVFATKAVITATMNVIADKNRKLVELNKNADKYVIDTYSSGKKAFPLIFQTDEKNSKKVYKGIESEQIDSWVTGKKIIHYTGKPFDVEVPYYDEAMPKDSVYAPKGYLIPSEFENIVEIMKLHGIKIETIKKEKFFTVEKYKFKNVKFGSFPFEGRFQPQYDFDKLKETVTVPAGTFYVPVNQRTVGVILHLLEPLGPDSFVKWGFFNPIFERKEYFEDYSMEPIARKMAEENPKLKEEFLKKVESDEKIKNSARQRLDFFYQRSPYADNQMNVYPIMRVVD